MKSFLIVICLLISCFSKAQNLDSLLHELSKAKEDTNKVNLYDKITYRYIYSDEELCRKYTDSLLWLSEKINYEKGQGRAYHYMGQYHYNKRDWKKMDVNLQKAEKIYKNIDDKESFLMVRNLYASYYRQIGDIDRALTMYIEILGYYRKMENKASEARILASVAFLFGDKERYKEAEEYYLKAVKIRKELGDDAGISMIYITLSALFNEQNQPDNALPYITKALEIQQALGNKMLIAHCEANLGHTYNNKKQYHKALDYTNSAFRFYESQQNNHLMIILHIYRAVSYTGLKDFPTAIHELNTAEKIIDNDTTLTSSLIDVYFQYYETYKASGDFKNALRYYELYNELNNENTTIEIQNNISQLKEQFEAGQREEEIKLLQEQNKTKDALLQARTYSVLALSLLVLFIVIGTIFIRRQNKLKQQKETAELEQRVLRTQMNPHFIFNSLNSIQRMYVEGNTEKANDFMADFAQLMRRVLENSGNTKISLQEELDTLRLYMELEKLRCKDSFSYNIDIDEDIAAFDVQLPPLIIQPFVENAIWHGVLPLKETRGEITVSLQQKNEDEILVTINDNGVGFENDETRKKHVSKGIQITEQRIGNKVQIDSEKGQGTTISFILKTVQ